MRFFDIENIFFTLWGYHMSYLEFFGALSGAYAVWLSARANVWSWPVGIVNVVLSFFLFYQVQLYPDVFLQLFFFVANLIGWWRWVNPDPGEEDKKKELRVSFMSRTQILVVTSLGLFGTYLIGTFAKNLHEFFPALFASPSAFPYADSFVTVTSIMTSFLMIEKKIECWIFWIIIDVVAAYLYFSKDIFVYGILYVAFCFIAAWGLYHWIKEYKSYKAELA
jgi:nicotinamide mononucleotide transporter